MTHFARKKRSVMTDQHVYSPSYISYDTVWENYLHSHYLYF